MKSDEMLITRRSFIASAASGLGFCVTTLSTGYGAARGAQVKSSDLEQFRAELLKLVNTERAIVGSPALSLDDLACQVADRHALDMATGKFLSHWGRDGRKAYQRYSFAGGFHATAENVSAADNLETLDPKYLVHTLAQMHMRMYAEVPPNDGHRQTILTPSYTHVGFGIAVADRSLRSVELYVAKYLHLDPYQKEAKRSDKVQLSGRLLSPKHRFRYAEVFYEPLPTPQEISWLRVPRPYALPDDYVTLKPRAPEGASYADGTRGSIGVDGNGKFRIPISFFKDAEGIYTVVIWISERASNKGFPVTNICIQAN